MSGAQGRPCPHDKSMEAKPMTILENRLGYRIIPHTSEHGHPGQLQNLDWKGHIDSVRPASGVEVELYGLLTGPTTPPAPPAERP